ncbi:MAG: hypothetical protein HUJ31_13630 [Pseudomonadales bacterium]|nr:hypothetical protein [Pseudomonadales bacterium]
MKKHLTKEEFTNLQPDFATGKAAVVVPRSIARQFFVRVDNKSIKATTGESAIIQKLIVWTGMATAPVLLGVCLLVLIIEMGWSSAFAVPVVGIFWTVLAGFTSDTGPWYEITAALAIAFLVWLVYTNNYALALLFFTLSIWVHRMTFMLAQHFLAQIVARSFDAYDMLIDHVSIE